ncbi:MAG: hypothetical protein ABGX16_06570 [Pirellulales bacterium]
MERLCTWMLIGVVLATYCGLSGCDKGGIARYDLKGQITYKGKPVPRGNIRFAPDTKKGNAGPGSSAEIVDGKYETMLGLGTVGGPHKVYIFGTDGVQFKNEFGAVIPIGRKIFSQYQTSADFPMEAATQDFEVPAKGKKKERR